MKTKTRVIGKAKDRHAFFDNPAFRLKLFELNGNKPVFYGQVTFTKVKGGVLGIYHPDVVTGRRPRLTR